MIFSIISYYPSCFELIAILFIWVFLIIFIILSPDLITIIGSCILFLFSYFIARIDLNCLRNLMNDSDIDFEDIFMINCFQLVFTVFFIIIILLLITQSIFHLIL
jgi:hypothetical protein